MPSRFNSLRQPRGRNRSGPKLQLAPLDERTARRGFNFQHDSSGCGRRLEPLSARHSRRPPQFERKHDSIGGIELYRCRHAMNVAWLWQASKAVFDGVLFLIFVIPPDAQSRIRLAGANRCGRPTRVRHRRKFE